MRVAPAPNQEGNADLGLAGGRVRNGQHDAVRSKDPMTDH